MPNMGVEVLMAIAAGNTVAQIASDMQITEMALDEWLSDPARGETVRRARKAGAAALAEQTLAIAEGAMPTKHPITGEPVADPSRDKLRIQARQWLAERRDRATWGAAKEGVTINIAGLHLDALRAKPPNVSRETLQASAEDVYILEGSADPHARDIGQDYDDSPLLS